MNKKFLLLAVPFLLTGCTLKIDNSNNNNNGGNGDNGNQVITKKGKYTIMIYMCGSDLESDGGLATMDLEEILSLSNKPEDVNIVIETGGARKWKTKYGINKSKLSRYHVEGTKLVLDEELTRASMGKSTTLQSFLEYGITNYCSDKMSLIYWNHGGALDGVCYDENYDDDSLTNDECETAYKNAWANTNYKGKMEWVGYDACLMAVQDVAYKNSKYFNYMVCSQEAEVGYGWDYDSWLKDLYANININTKTLLSSICDSFIAENDYTETGKYSPKSNEQTLSVLDLSKAEAYKSAWEGMVSKLSISSSSAWSTFVNVVNKVKKFGGDDDPDYSSYNNGYTFDVFDAKGFLTSLSTNSTYSNAKTAVNETLTAFDNLVVYNKIGAGAGNANGLCFFCPISGYNEKDYYTKKTDFSSWSTLVNKYGTFYTGRN